ncbi:MAG: YdhK family protein [Tetragenococcus sp.]|nr:YdhK family protein [Tetragenococcus sp.]
MKKVKSFTLATLLASTVLLSACSNNDNDEEGQMNDTSTSTTMTMDDSDQGMEDSSDDMDHGDMDHGDMEMEHNRNEEEPENMQDAEDPQYSVGDEVEITDAHMDIMEGVTATISGAYDTTLYQVTFTPEDSDEPLEDHKWVVDEEIESDEDTDEYETGDEVTLTADHMEGMQGQTAEITGVHEGPAYMIDFEPADGSEEFTNHKWVTEDELAPADED